jgi:hypothetical protein
MMVPTMEVMDMMISMVMVNLREVKKDHARFKNEFFKMLPFVAVVVVSRRRLFNPVAG